VVSLYTHLPRDVYVLQAGLVVNAFGNGAAAPFVVIYLHDVRGVPLGIAGLAAATSAVCALLSALVGGSMADRRGARGTMLGGLAVSTVAFALYPLVRETWQALAVAVLAGTGIGIWLTMQSALLAAIVPAEVRHVAFAQQRVAANIGLGLGGFSGGLIVRSDDPESFATLFLLNAATFVIYGGFLVALRVGRTEQAAGRGGGSYRGLLRDRAFVRLLALTLLFVAGTVALVNALFPVFAKNNGAIGTGAIGTLFLLNSLIIVGAQIPIARALEGHLRMRGLALMGALFAICWLLVVAGGLAPGSRGAFALFALAFVSLAVGECLYDSIQGPLAAALAPERLMGRYMAANGFTWQLGFIVGPAVGGLALARAPYALWIGAAALALAGAAYALRLDRLLPAEHRRTPARAGAASSVRSSRVKPAKPRSDALT
jgi:MFS family permease